jgi:hypothetical protein
MRNPLRRFLVLQPPKCRTVSVPQPEGMRAMHTELCAGGSSAGAGGVPQSTRFLRPGSILSSAASSVAIGVLVALSRYLGLMLWRRARVPSALSRRVRRRSYLNTVLAESTFPEVIRLDVYAPRLQPARDNGHIAIIQAEWEKINDRGRVRVLIINNDEGLQAGAELLDRASRCESCPMNAAWAPTD